MRTHLFILALIVLNLQACSNNKASDAKLIDEGKALVASNDCGTCHQPTNKIIGPAHLDVAKKYETTDANIQILAARIIKGGSGVWGEIPMNAHTDITQEHAEKMARYVLSLDEGE